MRRPQHDTFAGLMHWFGQDWGAALCRECPHVPVPVGAACLWCAEPIAAADRGVTALCFTLDAGSQRRAQHLECHLRSALGGANHIRGTCSCCGGTDDPDPPGLSKRAAAHAAVAAYERKTGRSVR